MSFIRLHFLRFEDFFTVAKGNMYTLADRVRVFTLKDENVGQEGFYTPSVMGVTVHPCPE